MRLLNFEVVRGLSSTITHSFPSKSLVAGEETAEAGRRLVARYGVESSGDFNIVLAKHSKNFSLSLIHI